MSIKFNKQSIKNAYNQGQKVASNIKQKAEEFIQKADMAINPPKLEVLKNKMTEEQRSYLLKSAKAGYAKRNSRPDYDIDMIFTTALEKELQTATKKAQKATDAYNKFKAKQDAAQAAFERLNGLNK